ncbi:MAG: MerR family transcriptional regulator [Clostridia bacterium]|nr:MerR family transcriptional regulator [Clostridia bacterium]
MYKIGELSKLCNISVKTLRYYDAEGLLIPDMIDKFTGYRYYSASKLDDCYRIIALKELGFSLDEIRTQLTANDNEKITAELDSKIAELNQLIITTEKQLQKIEELRKNLTEGESKMFNILIRKADEVRVAFVRKNYASKSDAIYDICKIKKSLPKTIVGKRRIVINYETEYRENDFDLASCVEITGSLPKNSPYSEKILSFDRSTATLICKKEELDDAYKAMIKHLDCTSYKACGAYYEIYHSDDTVELKVPVCASTNEPLYQAEHIALPFENDPDACGKWEMIDILPTREHFVYGKPKCGHLAWLNEIYFIDGGQSYWSVFGWTKGYLFTHGPKLQTVYINKYTIENYEDRKLLFLEMYNYCDGGADGSFDVPEIWVYEKVKDQHYSSPDDIQKCDPIDYPFINDPAILGTWKVRDFYVTDLSDFDPKRQNWATDELYLLRMEFKKDGVFSSTTKNGTNTGVSSWTKGLILNKRSKTASAYFIKEINGQEYLFREWKSGDYSFGGGRAYWYVFTRE